MRRDTSKPEVPWSAKVSTESKSTFRALLPMYGAQVWTIQTALEKFLDICDNDPRMVDKARDQIHRHMYEESKTGLKDNIEIKIPRQLYIRFDKHFPMMGGASWFIRTVIDRVNHQLENLVIEERVEAAVRTIFQDDDANHSSSLEA